jgi:hypothetical protein
VCSGGEKLMGVMFAPYKDVSINVLFERGNLKFQRLGMLLFKELWITRVNKVWDSIADKASPASTKFAFSRTIGSRVLNDGI